MIIRTAATAAGSFLFVLVVTGCGDPAGAPIRHIAFDGQRGVGIVAAGAGTVIMR